MKITNNEIIKSGERELIDAITAELDWGAVEDIFREQHNLGIDEDVQYKHGDIVVHNNQVAYSLEFEVKVTVSVVMDREGNHLSVRLSDTQMEDGDEGTPSSEEDFSAPDGENDSSMQEKDIPSGDQIPVDPDPVISEHQDHDMPSERDPEEEVQGDDAEEAMPEAESPMEQTRSEGDYEEAMADLQSAVASDDGDAEQYMDPDLEAEDKISGMVSEAEEMISKMED